MWILLLIIPSQIFGYTEKCSPTFEYNGKMYDGCITLDSKSPWCSLDAVYRGRHKKCEKECVFPFEYKGKSYNACILSESDKFWCSVDAVYNGNFKFCDGDSFAPNNENIALGKETFASSVGWGGDHRKAVDGYRDSNFQNGRCSHTHVNGMQWLLVNLNAVYDIHSIDLYFRNDNSNGQMGNFSVYIGQKYTSCQENIFESFQLCASVDDKIKQVTTSLACNRRGQYILLKRPGYDKSSKGGPLIICELEATGTLVTDVKPFKAPQIPKDKLPDFDFGAHRTITKDVNEFQFHWNTLKIHALKDTVEPILWYPDKQMIFMAGAQLGKGKILVVSGYSVWRNNIQSQPTSTIAKGVKKWMVGDENALLIDLKYQKEISQTKANGILFVRHWQPEPMERLKEAVELVREGKIGGLVLPLLEKNLDHFDFILKEIGVYIASHRQNQPYLRTHQMQVVDMKKQPMFPIQTLVSSYTATIKFNPQISVALKEVPEDRLREIGISKDYVKSWLSKYRDLAEWKIPCNNRPIESVEDKIFVTAYNNYLLTSDLLLDSNVKAPGVDQYPGDITSPKLLKKRLKVIASIKNEYHSTGLYLPAGHTMTVTIHSGSEKHWFIQIGCWTDNISKKEKWTRYPLIHSKHYLPKTKIFSAFGGNVLIRNTNSESGTIELSLAGVVEAPYFNLRDPGSVSNWMSRRNADAPWGEIVGDSLNFCILSKTFNQWNTSYMMEFMDETYDKIVKSNHHLLGHDWRKLRREMIVYDRQISAGSGHSGYPIMGMLNWHNGLNLEKNKKGGNWGVSHELGHNIQNRKFTFSGTGEVTNNIFALWNNYYVFNLPYFGNGQGRLSVKNIKNYLVNQKADYQYWSKNPFVALAIFPQMANTFSWNLFKNVFRTYWDTNIPQPGTDQEKIDEWMKRSSNATKLNLAPLFDLWGLPLSDDARKSVEKLECFLPNDFITEAVPERVNLILNKYSNKCRRSASKVVNIHGDVDRKPLKENDVIFL